jgi:phosphonoacetate hydrolase
MSKTWPREETDMPLPQLVVNGRTYARTSEPLVVLCIDGGEPAYHERAIAAGAAPFLGRLTNLSPPVSAKCVMPSFTNPNNLSIATGVPPAVHGICGNYFLDPDSGAEVLMNDPKWLRVPTLFAAYSRLGSKVAVVTAKDKLRRLLGAGLENGICFSAERAGEANMAVNGIDDVLDTLGRPQPSVYSADLSELVMAAGVSILERERPDLMYLSLSDYVQHMHAPGTPEANDFYAMLDRYCERIDRAGAVLVITADHGMNAKSTPEGAPRVLYLQKCLDGWLGESRARVILPITDPYTVHHGGLGSFATVYLDPAVDVLDIAQRVSKLSGIELTLTREKAADRFALPPDRIGDLVVIGDRDTTIGTTPERHDLTGLREPLRSHGGLAEQDVPFLVNRRLKSSPSGYRLHNYDAYWAATNLV